MPKQRFMDEQIALASRHTDAGAAVDGVIQKMAVLEATLFRCKAALNDDEVTLSRFEAQVARICNSYCFCGQFLEVMRWWAGLRMKLC